jgi:hypothetical protein
MYFERWGLLAPPLESLPTVSAPPTFFEGYVFLYLVADRLFVPRTESLCAGVQAFGVQAFGVQAFGRAGVQEANVCAEWECIAIGGKRYGMLFVLVMGIVC